MCDWTLRGEMKTKHVDFSLARLVFKWSSAAALRAAIEDAAARAFFIAWLPKTNILECNRRRICETNIQWTEWTIYLFVTRACVCLDSAYNWSVVLGSIFAVLHQWWGSGVPACSGRIQRRRWRCAVGSTAPWLEQQRDEVQHCGQWQRRVPSRKLCVGEKERLVV